MFNNRLDLRREPLRRARAGVPPLSGASTVLQRVSRGRAGGEHHGVIFPLRTVTPVLAALTIALTAAPAATAAPGAAPGCSDPTAPLTVEEQRLTAVLDPDAPPVGPELARLGGFDDEVARFASALCGVGKRDAAGLAQRTGEGLWRAAVERAQAPQSWDAHDDRPLYWARLGMTKALRQWKPRWTLPAAERSALVDRLDRASRGLSDVRFRADAAPTAVPRAAGDDNGGGRGSADGPHAAGSPAAGVTSLDQLGSTIGADPLALLGARAEAAPAPAPAPEERTAPEDRAAVRRIALTGFDPFFLDGSGITRSNPSGAAALQLDGRVFDTPQGRVLVEVAVLPVTWGEFDKGIVERFYGSTVTGGQRPHAFVTVSQGRPGQFDVERWAARWRGWSPDNNNASSPGVVPDAAGWPQPSTEFIETTLPHERMTTTPTGDYPVLFNRGFCEFPAGATPAPGAQRCGTGEPTPGATAASGGGGDYLSNESMYRANRVRTGLGATDVRGGHLHTPVLSQPEGDALTDGFFEAERRAIADQVVALVALV
ncbi:putative secreted protein [Actinosynnema pretiosum subsp. pretiosum]|nr:putative secreted protein [Actinosynnema pretiosum subsp. pretiosum]